MCIRKSRYTSTHSSSKQHLMAQFLYSIIIRVIKSKVIRNEEIGVREYRMAFSEIIQVHATHEVLGLDFCRYSVTSH